MASRISGEKPSLILHADTDYKRLHLYSLDPDHNFFLLILAVFQTVSDEAFQEKRRDRDNVNSVFAEDFVVQLSGKTDFLKLEKIFKYGPAPDQGLHNGIRC